MVQFKPDLPTVHSQWIAVSTYRYVPLRPAEIEEDCWVWIKQHRRGFDELTPNRICALQPKGSTRHRTTGQCQESAGDVCQAAIADLPSDLLRIGRQYDYEKTEQDYSRLTEMLVKARRGGVIPFDAIRDDGNSLIDPSSANLAMSGWKTSQTAPSV